ncbi:hypothetical protein [Hugenholtzia roseola]|uniref:hypothetical protein n=1 Tax=Hugenholtzia roseola TaxID=1002 RepID=UPI000409EA4C|nr:hypothetical protein [Hugenholtzia roseola]
MFPAIFVVSCSANLRFALLIGRSWRLRPAGGGYMASNLDKFNAAYQSILAQEAGITQKDAMKKAAWETHTGSWLKSKGFKEATITGATPNGSGFSKIEVIFSKQKQNLLNMDKFDVSGLEKIDILLKNKNSLILVCIEPIFRLEELSKNIFRIEVYSISVSDSIEKFYDNDFLREIFVNQEKVFNKNILDAKMISGSVLIDIEIDKHPNNINLISLMRTLKGKYNYIHNIEPFYFIMIVLIILNDKNYSAHLKYKKNESDKMFDKIFELIS